MELQAQSGGGARIIILFLILLHGLVEGQQTPESATRQTPPPVMNPYLYYGPHGYQTWPHSRCQEVPTVNVTLSDLSGAWNLIQVVSSHPGKPFNRAPYLCPESRIQIDTSGGRKMNISQISHEWPLFFLDVMEWTQSPAKSGLFWHEENIFSLWTLKVMEFDPLDKLVIFYCIDYSLWPGWNHRGVSIFSRGTTLASPVKRKLSREAHEEMRMDYNRFVNTTSCDPDEYFKSKNLIQRWHPHKRLNPEAYTAPITPYMSRKHRRNLKALD
eukprot:TRINITY_DN3118_c0_g1_i1.p1 TRINITY_DN3118_c0_g1~~TRINITY_DN3118_c0_g1_i1.p1  ORF type:complete len:295 (-),score=59.95 TRINITY_DN3118_c0_g1_i1:116-928(-)